MSDMRIHVAISAVAGLVVLVAGQPAAWGWGPIGDDPSRWLRYARSVEIDGEGALFVGGGAGPDGVLPGPVVSRLDPTTGEELWRSDPGGSGTLWDIAVDPSGDVVAAAHFHSPDEPVTDFLVFKVSKSDGSEEWRYTFEPDSAELDWNRGIAVTTDAAGDVLATGFSGPAGLMQTLVVVKLSGQMGNEMWRHTIPGVCPQLLSSRGDDIAVDTQGNVLVAGMTCLFSPNYHDFTVLKLSGSDGTEIWRNSIDGTGAPDHPRDREAGSLDWARALTLDSEGNVIATGTMRNLESEYDLLVVKLSGADGSEQWRQVLNGPGNNRDSGWDVALDPGGDVIVSGGLASVPHDTYEDFALVKLSGVDGSRLWEKILPGTGDRDSTEELAVRLAVGGGGDVVAVGRVTFADTSKDFVAVKLGADGQEVWRRVVSGTGSPSLDFAEDVALDGQGDAVAVGWILGLCQRWFGVAFKFNGADGSGEEFVDPCPMEGARFVLRDSIKYPEGRKLSLRSNDPDSGDVPRGDHIARPDLHGGKIDLYNRLTGERASLALPAENWRWIPSRVQWRYVDRDRSEGPCTSVVLGLNLRKRSILRAVCRGSSIGFSLDEPSQRQVGVNLTLGEETRVRYCAEFGGALLEDRPAAPSEPGMFKAVLASAPASCFYP
jgi:outer membrane protein assembly factor BamB